jgi:hypothetical protein
MIHMDHFAQNFIRFVLRSLFEKVNVSVKSAGRFGAPETERGPSGVGSEAEHELMRISFHSTVS